METLHNIYHKSTNNLVAGNLTTEELDRFFRTNYKHKYDKPIYRIETFYKNKFINFMEKYCEKFVFSCTIFLAVYLIIKIIYETWMI